jgi:hypothetical protein
VVKNSARTLIVYFQKFLTRKFAINYMRMLRCYQEAERRIKLKDDMPFGRDIRLTASDILQKSNDICLKASDIRLRRVAGVTAASSATAQSKCKAM